MPKSRSKAGAPRGPDSFLVVHPFMWRALDLKGVELLVFARAYGFCKNGGTFYESRAGTASYLGISERSVTRAIGSLVERGVLVDLDPDAPPDGVSTRAYTLSDHVAREFPCATPDKLPPPDSLSGETAATGDGVSGERVPSWHLKSKSESKLD